MGDGHAADPLASDTLTPEAQAREALVARVRAGDRRAIGALIRALEDEAPGARDTLRRLLVGAPRARLVGVTGAAGVGKSTLVDALVAHHRARHERVAVVAVDPSSPYTGGAILGDRVRMQRHATDLDVFVRSLATRGASGGLARATWDAAAVLAAAGYPIIYVETTGAGQAELAIARLADVVVVVTVPGMGDDVQALKAGILEIADVLVVNKADREGAERAAQELEAMVALRRITDPAARAIPVLKTVARTEADGEGASRASADGGVSALVAAIATEAALRSATSAGAAGARGEGARRETARARELVLDALAAEARRRAALRLAGGGAWDAALRAVSERNADPVALAEALLDHAEDGDTLKGC